MMAFETAKGYVAGKAGPHYPAPVEAIKVIQKGAGEERGRAQAIEAKAFAKLALSSVAFNWSVLERPSGQEKSQQI